MKIVRSFLLASAVLSSSAALASSCESLAALALPDSTITLAQSVPAGELNLAGAGTATAALRAQDLPAFCRVAATLTPTSDSVIQVEVWLPASNWNGKFQAVGNGGWAGSISYSAMGQALRRGYATASTDTGHSGGSARFALGHHEKLIDFGYRAVHEMTVKAKAIIAAFYGDAPRLSYWNGCSTGGRQGLKEAQQYPSDFDGIIAGAPANYRTHLQIGQIWTAGATLKDAASFIPPGKYPLIHKAALEACDALDGIKDGILENPSRCHFDPKVLECKGEDTPACLTRPQVEAARKIYAGAKNPRTGQPIWPGLMPGSELGWGQTAGGPEPIGLAMEYFKYVVFEDPNWDWRTFDFDTDTARTEKLEYGMNATDPNLKQFVGHGGKLLLYHGWSDPLITPLNTISYYKSVVDTMGGTSKTADFARLFLVPGMGHCGGGEGPNSFDAVSALEQWVEKGRAPEQLTASHLANGTVDRTRPLCPYPQVATWKGTGSTDAAASFVCSSEKP
jgi:feruloyl esterase